MKSRRGDCLVIDSHHQPTTSISSFRCTIYLTNATKSVMTPWNFFHMSQDMMVLGSLLHCVFQGVLVALFPGVMSREREESWQFKTHIVIVNSLALGQTVIASMPAFSNDSNRNTGVRAPGFLPPLFNAFLALFVQAFYMLRCWKILGRRWLYILPYLALWSLANGGNFAMSVLNSNELRSDNQSSRQRIALGLWAFSSLVVDLLMTITTGFYLYKTRKGSSGYHQSVFFTAWNVIWAAAVPPMALIVAVIIDGYLIPDSEHEVATLLADLSGKIYALSLMITLAGRGYVRQKLSEVNIGRISSGGTAPHRSVHNDFAAIRARSVRYQQDQVLSSEIVTVQLEELAPGTNRVAGESVGDNNESDGEAAPSQYSKGDDTKFHL
ncbi:unnamed protein product [Rhizoctonia solani]|uniref:Transmembrane protein n=1 Tax=Rhizoctonia solani TaxID=456999 RepID=A0A8H3HM06_9AGAM|nr:unnamed protein product [Rhizoctonia solani]CAE6519756.1 unnamed protein product [Rhizoctonia solani]